MSKAIREPLAPADAAWLRMEEPTNLMMITAVLMFDQPLDLARLASVLEERMVARFDRFRKRAIIPKNGLGVPYWELDPHFTLATHLHCVALPPPGDQPALQALVSDLMSTPLDFSKPLWQFHVAENYNGGCALIARLHHSLADGIALVHVLLSLTDPEAIPQPPQPTSIPPAPPESSAASVLGTLRRTGERLADPADFQQLARQSADAVAALGKLLFLSPDPHTPLKGPLGVLKKAVWSAPIALADIKRIGRVTGGTVNDVLLAAATGALRRYLLAHGTDIDRLNIRAVVPVNLRPPEQPPQMGNFFGIVFLSLPIGEPDPYDRLLVLRERMEAIKGSPEAIIAYSILVAVGSAPEQIQDLAVDLFESKATTVISNVPGPRQTIYLAGSPVRGTMFWVPQSGRLGIGLSMFSYAGEVLIGIATDVGLIPDPEGIIDGFHAELDILRQLAWMVEANGQ